MSVRCSHPWHRAPLLVEGAPCAITGGKSTLSYTFSTWQSTRSARRDTSVTTRRRWFAVWGWQTEMTCWHAPSGYPHNTSSNLCPLLQQYIGAPILCKHTHPPRLRRDVSDSLRSSFHDPSTSDIGGDVSNRLHFSMVLTDQTTFDKVDDGNIHRIRGIKNTFTIRGDTPLPQSNTRSVPNRIVTTQSGSSRTRRARWTS